MERRDHLDGDDWAVHDHVVAAKLAFANRSVCPLDLRPRLGELGIGELLDDRDRLDRDHPVDARVAAEVDGAHRAAAELALELEEQGYEALA
jgi:hypothetical protein